MIVMGVMKDFLTHLECLKSEVLAIVSEVVSEAKNPAVLYSGRKDSEKILYLLRKGVYPAQLPFL